MNILLNKNWVKENITWIIRIYLEMKENNDTTYPNLWDIAKVMRSIKFKAVNAYDKKKERSQINNFNFVEELEKNRVN